MGPENHVLDRCPDPPTVKGFPAHWKSLGFSAAQQMDHHCYFRVQCFRLAWVSSFLTAHQHIRPFQCHIPIGRSHVKFSPIKKSPACDAVCSQITSSNLVRFIAMWCRRSTCRQIVKKTRRRSSLLTLPTTPKKRRCTHIVYYMSVSHDALYITRHHFNLLWICCRPTTCSYSCAEVDEISTDIARRAVRLW